MDSLHKAGNDGSEEVGYDARAMKRHKSHSGLVFIILSIFVILLGMGLAVLQPHKQSLPRKVVQATIIQSHTEAPKPIVRMAFGPLEMFGPQHPPKLSDAGSEVADLKSAVPKKPKPVWHEPETVRRAGAPAKIVIVIDDMGMDKRCAEVIAMKEPLTLSFLPYSPNLQAQTEKARANGHQLIIHVPMEPKAQNIDPGPNFLNTRMSKEELDAALERDFQSFNGYVGINNHMGSKMTEDRTHMDWVMEELKKHNLMFLDSMTIADSVGAESAAQHGLAYARRDVFLDHETDLASVRASLHQLDTVALKRGYAVAIGHPKDNTIAALKEWLPTMKDKGLVLVPLTEIMHPASSAKASFASFGPPLQPHE